MIEINLIPPEFKKKKKDLLAIPGLNLPPEVVIGVGGVLLILLIGAHILLLSTNLAKLALHEGIENEWKGLTATKQQVDDVIKKLRQLQSTEKALEGIAGPGGLFRSEELNILSDSLPRNVWLGKVTLTRDILFVEGSALYRPAAKSDGIYALISNLKKNKNFAGHFTEIKLGPIQKRLIIKVEVEDFSITAKLK